MLRELTIDSFTKELSSNSPAPGGGSVAALSASLAASLNSMVFNLTIGKKAYNEYDEDIKKAINKSLEASEALRENFLKTMEEDTEVFMKVMAAFKLPKDTEEEKATRKEKIEEAYKLALDVPFNLSKMSYELYEHIAIAVKYGNVNAISDAGVAALLLQTAIESAVLNVKINLSSIKDEEIKNNIKSQCENLVLQGQEKRNELLKLVEEKIGA